MWVKVRTEGGSTLPSSERQGAPGRGREVDEESLSMGIRELVRGWGGKSEPRDDDERLEGESKKG